MSNQLPYPVQPSTDMPMPYQASQQQRTDNMNTYPTAPPYPGEPSGNSNLPYPVQASTGAPGYPPIPQVQNYPPYPSQNQPYPTYPPQNPSYPPQNPSYPPQNPPYSPQNPPYSPQNPPYAPQIPPYPPQNQPFPSPNQPYPPYPIAAGPVSTPSAPDPGVYSTEPRAIQGNIKVNEGIGKAVKSKIFEKGRQIAQGALDKSSISSVIPSSAMDILKGASYKKSDYPDGNCMSGNNTHQGHLSNIKSGRGSVKKWCGQDYAALKQDCRSRGMLFEDPEFPASNHLLVDDNNQFIISYFGRTQFDRNSIQWLRPHEICQKMNTGLRPQMFVKDADRFDINQGEIGNCWFLAAVANLAENKKCFQRVVPSDQDFDRNYSGIFRFRFWRFGEWVEIVIDDRLPTRNGKLIYLRSVEKNEFWGALLEKAYAKLHGSYRALEGGLTIEAAVDFSGGIPEMIELDRLEYSKERLFYIMSKADNNGAFMGCALTSDPRRARIAQDLGLQSRHAYTITKVVEIRSAKVPRGIPLVRLRNPHGNNREWKGEWSDGDRNWRSIPAGYQRQLGLTFEDDGEFYMSFRDFTTYFGEVEICHLTPDSIDDHNRHTKFEVFHFYGEWKSGSTAGGCGNGGKAAFASNPQFFINLNDPDRYDGIDECHVVISLLQRQKKRKAEHAIGFKLFRCDLTDKRLNEQFFRHNVSIDRTESFINLREISRRLALGEGRYCIVPCTFQQGEEGQFLLRVFVEKSWGSSDSARGHVVNDAMDSSNSSAKHRFDSIDSAAAGGISSGMAGMNIHNDGGAGGKSIFKKHQNKIAGFALKQLEKTFPKSAKHLKDFYNWTTSSDEDYDLLRSIIKHL